MQEEEKELEMACTFPCEVLAMTIESEIRVMQENLMIRAMFGGDRNEM